MVRWDDNRTDIPAKASAGRFRAYDPTQRMRSAEKPKQSEY